MLKVGGGLGDARCIVIDEFLGKVVRDTVDARLETFVAGCLARLDETFDLVPLALGAYKNRIRVSQQIHRTVSMAPGSKTWGSGGGGGEDTHKPASISAVNQHSCLQG